MKKCLTSLTHKNKTEFNKKIHIWKFSLIKILRERLTADNKMGKISKILFDSLFIASVYANNFAVPSCNDDTPVNICLPIEKGVNRLKRRNPPCAALPLSSFSHGEKTRHHTKRRIARWISSLDSVYS